MVSFKDFVYERTLNNMQDQKLVYILGHLKDTDENNKVLIKLEKEAFKDSDLAFLIEVNDQISKEDMYFQNDIYRKFTLEMSP